MAIKSIDGRLAWTARPTDASSFATFKVFQAAAETGSMAKAAAHMAITQPAVSYAISELEQTVGVPLLDRSSQGVTPTVYGRALLERSAIVFNELRHGISEIASLADPEVGELRIGTTPPMSAVASAVFNRLVPRYPRMTVRTQCRRNRRTASPIAPARCRDRHQQARVDGRQ